MAISSVLGSSALLPAGLGFRNLIINGAMQVNQRTAVATAVTGITSSGYYTADRFRFGVSVGTWSQTTVADAPAGFKNSLKLQVTSAASPTAGQVAYLTQAIEGQNCQGFAKGTSSAKPLVLTFWVKAFQTGTFICQITDYTNNRMVCLPYTISVSATWEQKTLYIPADTTGALANDNSGAFEVEFWLAAGSNTNSGTLQTTWGSVVTANQAVGQTNVSSSTSNYWQITGVQLEQNLQPTPFEQRPIGVELALCQRYYEKSYLYGVPVGTNTTHGLVVVSGSTDGGGYIYTSIPMKVSKRISAPQSQSSSNSVFKLYTNDGTADQVFYYRNGANGVATTTCGTNNVGQDNISIYVFAGSGAATWVSSLLVFHWVYNAEL